MSTTLKNILVLLVPLSTAVAAIVLVASSAQAHEWFWRERSLPYPYTARDPSDPGSGGSPLEYRRVIGGLQSYRPVDPLPWGEMNKRVTPKSGSTQGDEH
jgi:hypothetical protein